MMSITTQNNYPDIVSVILSGGSGTRLWPLSRASYPKQFLPLVNNKSLLQASVERLQNPILPLMIDDDSSHKSTLVIGNNRHRFLIAEQLQEINVNADILLEPVARNTAPAIAIAAWQLLKQGRQDAIMVVMPSDHLIEDTDSFQQSLMNSIDVVKQGYIITFGIVPRSAEVGYGYIKARNGKPQSTVYDVEKFVEKPTIDKANQYLQSGNYFWNSGMFCFTAKTILDALKQYQTNIYECTKLAIEGAKNDLDFIRVNESSFQACDDISIDYAIMEKATNIKMVAAHFDWSDLGTWRTLKSIYPEDCDKNIVVGNAVAHKSHGNFIYANNRLVSTLGLNNMSIIDTDDSVLVMNNDYIDDVPNLLHQLKNNHQDLMMNGTIDYRPWGYFRSIQVGDNHQVKNIVVNPGSSLSLQKHKYRSEHWVVVKGSALVVLDEEEKLLEENQSIYIPVGSLHRLTNPGDIPLQIIEIQTGSYLGEDDIIRFDDVYNRSKTDDK